MSVQVREVCELKFVHDMSNVIRDTIKTQCGECHCCLYAFHTHEFCLRSSSPNTSIVAFIGILREHFPQPFRRSGSGVSQSGNISFRTYPLKVGLCWGGRSVFAIALLKEQYESGPLGQYL